MTDTAAPPKLKGKGNDKAGLGRPPGRKNNQPKRRVTVLVPFLIWSAVIAKLMFRISVPPVRDTIPRFDRAHDCAYQLRPGCVVFRPVELPPLARRTATVAVAPVLL